MALNFLNYFHKDTSVSTIMYYVSTIMYYVYVLFTFIHSPLCIIYLFIHSPLCIIYVYPPLCIHHYVLSTIMYYVCIHHYVLCITYVLRLYPPLCITYMHYMHSFFSFDFWVFRSLLDRGKVKSSNNVQTRHCTEISCKEN